MVIGGETENLSPLASVELVSIDQPVPDCLIGLSPLPSERTQAAGALDYFRKFSALHFRA